MEEIVDKYLNRQIEIGLNQAPIKVEEEMEDRNQDRSEEWRIWYPIPSKVTDEELNDFEENIGYKFPESYRKFLKYKHFYELNISEYSFCKHPVNVWKVYLNDMIYENPPEFLIEEGRIPFADWSDWGLLCFDTTVECENNNYPIVLWDHEREDEFEFKYSDFEGVLNALNKEKPNASTF